MRRLFLKLWRRRRMQQDLEAEMAFHREMAAANGNPMPFGHTPRITEQSYDLWRFVFLENLWRDIVYGARGLLRHPALVASALLSLGLGIGANTTMFSLGLELLFSEPSVRDASSLVHVRLAGNSHASQPAVDFLRRSEVFAEVAGENEEVFVNWNDGVETHPLFAVFTSRNFFSVTGTPVALGRGFAESDPKEVVVLHHRFWMAHFNGDPNIVGRTMNIDGRPYTIVGVLPANHRTMIGFGMSPNLYLPAYLDTTILEISARLKPGMTLEQARAAVKTVAVRMDQAIPESFKYADNIRVEPVGALERLRTESDAQAIAMFFLALLMLTALVLLIACVNVASLLLARASVRKEEIAVRLALGASRGRLLQQLLTESMLLALSGAALGLILSQIVARTVTSIELPIPIPIHLHAEADYRLMLYAALMTGIATVAAGLLPALQSVRESISGNLQRSAKMRLRRALVVVQMAFCVIVLFTGFLFLRNLLQSSRMSPGFDIRRTVRAEVHMVPAAYKTSESKSLLIDRALQEFQALPGIEAVAAARIIPFTDNTRFASDLTFPASNRKVHAQFTWNAVTPDFFRAMDIPLVQGRAFDRTDRKGNELAVIVNPTFVQRYLGGLDPVGTIFLWGATGQTPFRIVGVAQGTKTLTIGENPQAQLYQPLAQIDNDRPKIQFVLRASTSPVNQLIPVRKVLHQLDPGAGAEVSTMYSSIGLAFLPSQVGGVLMGSVGVLGLLLAAVGLYGVMVYSVARRTREIGVRMAIGARPADIAGMVLRESGRLLATGTLLGLTIAWFVTKPLAVFLVPGMSTTAPTSFLAVVGILVLTGLIATWGPMRRALSVDPLSSLRHE